MKLLRILVVLFSALIGVATAQVKSTTTNYINVEVRGTLHKESSYWYIEAEDATFPQFKAKVILERSEDKDRELSEFLDEHLDREMVARGMLDTRRIKDPFTIFIYFHLRSNIWSADEKEPINPA